MAKEGTVTGENRFYGISLCGKGSVYGKIEVGAPMDNDRAAGNCLLTQSGDTNWDVASKDENGTYRRLLYEKTEYNHAPFSFLWVPNKNPGNVHMTIHCDVSQELSVEVYQDKAYKTIGVIAPDGLSEYCFDFVIEPEGDTKEEAQLVVDPGNTTFDAKYEHGNHKIVFEKVILRNARGEETNVFDMQTDMTVEFHYHAFEELPRPVFCFCVYLPDGRCATQWFSTDERGSDKMVYGKGKCMFYATPLLLGKGSYVCSVGIMDRPPYGDNEEVIYHMIDRSIFFEIKQQVGRQVELGLCLQPFQFFAESSETR